MVVIGVDPDSEAHGVAIYRDGTLEELTTMQGVELAFKAKGNSALVSIENVCANGFIYGKNVQASKFATAKVGISVGKVQQAQIELCRLLDWAQVNYVLHKPQKGNWAKNKAQFQAVTGWTSRSNEDTRSAAFFGYLALTRLGEG